MRSPVCIFFLNVGRSGSMTVAREFGLYHEPDGPYPNRDRALARSSHAIIYGESSHFWKDHLEELFEAFPEATYFHLVRNGKDVVKSMQQRSFYLTPRQAEERGVIFRDKDYRIRELPYFRPGMGRFEKLCWYWKHYNEVIEKVGIKMIRRRVRVEDLHLQRRENPGPKHNPWSPGEEDVFRCICSDTMARYGYPL